MMDSNIESMKQSSIYEKTRQNKYPYYSKEAAHQVGWLTALIYVYGIEAAQMGIMEHSHEFTRYDYELSHFLCQLISLEMQKDELYRHNHALMHSTLLSDLVQGRLIDKTVLKRASQLGWATTEYMYMLTVFDRNYGVFDQNAQVIAEQLHQLYPTSRWVIFESKIVVLLILDQEEDMHLNTGTALNEYLVTNHLTAAVSERFSDLSHVKWKYMQCLAAYEIGVQMHSGSALFFYKDYCLHHIGTFVSKEFPLSMFFHDGVVALEKYDRENSTELLITLKAYLQYINDPLQASQKLFIHKNTLFYRINKIKDLFKLDLNSGYERLRIQLTMIFMEI